jgi:glycolate oxidase FAD binding subunit
MSTRDSGAESAQGSVAQIAGAGEGFERLVVRPATMEEMGEALRSAPGFVLPRGGGTKPTLSTPPSRLPPGAASGAPVTLVETTALTGITDYNPSEFTFTARAGTRVAEIAAALDEHGQGLPFDPPFVEAGATLGGAIAAGLSGPGRIRYGGLRDFLLGVVFVDGSGDPVRGGGRVVKNAAGLDIARLMVGSLGRLGILTEATFKVFPRPATYGTVRIPCRSVKEGWSLFQRLGAMQLEYEGLELAPDETAVYVRLGGIERVLAERLAQIAEPFGGSVQPADEEARFWRESRELAWAPLEQMLVRVALAPQQMDELDTMLSAFTAQRRYGAGGHVAWVAWDPARSLETLDGLLTRLGVSGLVLRGAADRPIIGVRTGQTLLARVRQVFDPGRRFLDL